MIRRPPRSTLSSSSAASDVYKRQVYHPRCSVDSLFQSEVIKPDWLLPPDPVSGHGVGVIHNGKVVNAMVFLNNPRLYLRYPPKVTIPHCHACPPGEDTADELVDKIGR
eukprot:TRINITY_DN16989_c0_g1_i3.p1 TRINITY_DN16989_c0_g1~~TRINITY_DN16989_c0_g1_i3.p1  ORF type:complete len:109 (+),score=26.52 TRINITY_DN16989_c0_g1_i3:96-422(+)